jgi:hypothetical protein
MGWPASEANFGRGAMRVGAIAYQVATFFNFSKSLFMPAYIARCPYLVVSAHRGAAKGLRKP